MALQAPRREGPRPDFGLTKVALCAACEVGEEGKATEGRPCLLVPAAGLSLAHAGTQSVGEEGREPGEWGR